MMYWVKCKQYILCCYSMIFLPPFLLLLGYYWITSFETWMAPNYSLTSHIARNKWDIPLSVFFHYYIYCSKFSSICPCKWSVSLAVHSAICIALVKGHMKHSAVHLCFNPKQKNMMVIIITTYHWYFLLGKQNPK